MAPADAGATCISVVVTHGLWFSDGTLALTLTSDESFLLGDVGFSLGETRADIAGPERARQYARQSQDSETSSSIGIHSDLISFKIHLVHTLECKAGKVC